MKKSLIGKSLISALLAGTAMSASAVDQTGTISFKGFIYNATCSIDLNDTNSPNVDVLMGRYPTSAFTETGTMVGGKDGYGELNISLTDCPDQGKVKLQLHGKPKDGDNELLELDNPNASTTAKNIAVLIFENDDTNNDPVVIDGSKTEEYNVSSSASWKGSYTAYYYSTADDVEAGQADATLNYTLSYN